MFHTHSDRHHTPVNIAKMQQHESLPSENQNTCTVLDIYTEKL